MVSLWFRQRKILLASFVRVEMNVLVHRAVGRIAMQDPNCTEKQQMHGMYGTSIMSRAFINDSNNDDTVFRTLSSKTVCVIDKIVIAFHLVSFVARKVHRKV